MAAACRGETALERGSPAHPVPRRRDGGPPLSRGRLAKTGEVTGGQGRDEDDRAGGGLSRPVPSRGPISSWDRRGRAGQPSPFLRRRLLLWGGGRSPGVAATHRSLWTLPCGLSGQSASADRSLGEPNPEFQKRARGGWVGTARMKLCSAEDTVLSFKVVAPMGLFSRLLFC